LIILGAIAAYLLHRRRHSKNNGISLSEPNPSDKWPAAANGSGSVKPTALEKFPAELDVYASPVMELDNFGARSAAELHSPGAHPMELEHRNIHRAELS
jgi:hypothetical protein